MNRRLPLIVGLLCLSLSLSLQAAPVISEVQAANNNTLLDADGDSSDWLEIYHSGPGAVSLEGYHLTDDAANLTKWTLPAVTVEAGEYLLLFASGKDRDLVGGELHTNFNLSSGGEYLALVAPDGLTVVDEFAPQFSAMEDDEAYGLPFSGTTYVTEGSSAEVLVPSNGNLGTSWTARTFSTDASWEDSETAVGFGSVGGSSLDGLVAYYDFEEGTGTQLLDQSGNDHHGSMVNMNANSDWVGSRSGLGTALDFDGSNDHVTLKAASTLGFDGNFTASAWVRLDNVNGDNTILGQNAPGLHLTTRGNKNYFGFWGNDTGGGSHVLSPGQWTHLAWRFDSGEQAVFVNGEHDNASGGHANLSSNAQVVLGRSNGDQGWFNGRMDEVVIFDRPLSNGEIAGLASGSPLAVGSDLETSMLGQNASAYVRMPFALSNLGQIDSLTLQMQYNDGFIAYLNGEEVARRNAPASVSWNSTATAARTPLQSQVWESFNLTSKKHLLVAGTNVLAIQGLNVSASDDSFFINPVLSAGALGAGSPGILNEPTPGRANTPVASLGQVADTKFSVDRGFFDAPFSVSISTTTPSAQIRYTTDGTEPTSTRGTLYSTPITISKSTVLRAVAYRNNYKPSNVDTQTYLFIDDVVNQGSTPPSGWPTGSVNGQVLDYGMDSPSSIGTTSTALKNALKSIDSISLVTDPDHLFSSSDGIYVHAGSRGRAWERPASVELLGKDGSESFQIDAGLRIRGGFSRSGNNPKHAFRLFFRNEYAGDLKYPLFGDAGVDRFKNMDLRTAQNYSWSFQGGTANTFVREVFARDSQAAMGQAHTRSRYYHLYVNGLYWGLYMTQERAEASFGKSYFGGDADDYDVVKSAGSSGGYTIEATDGEMAGWEAYWNLANQLAATSNPTTRLSLYQRLQGLNPDGTRNANYPVYLDVDNLIDYMMIILFVGSYDAPVSNFLGNNRPNNWFSVWNRSGEFGFQYFAHDCEHSLGTGSGATITNRNGPWPAGQTLNYSNPQWIHQQLMALDAYRLRFGDRAHALLFNDGLLTPSQTIARVDARAGMIDQAIIAESARWGDAKRGNPLRRSDWLNAVSAVRSYLSSRPSVLLDQFKNTRRYNNGNANSGTTSAPLYPSVVAPSFNQHGGHVGAGFGLQFTAAGGTVYYTMDGSDPRVENGSVSATAKTAQEGSIQSQTLYRASDGLRVLVPTNGALGTSWRNLGFNDASWTAGSGGVGYDENTTYDALIDVDVIGAMNNKNTSIYIRSAFNVADPSAFQGLILRMKFEDGFVAFLNGQEVASFNPPGSLTWNSEATGLHDDADAQSFIDFDLTTHLGKLVAGTNVLAFHGLNDNLNSSDFLCDPELVGTRVSGGSAVTLPSSFAEVNARTLQNGEWSALNAAVFVVGAVPATNANLVISEIMYHPAPPSAAEIAAGFTDADDFEYLELMNISGQAIDLTGYQFADGLTFLFPQTAGSIIEPGQRVLLVKNRAAFAFRYGASHVIAGEYGGSLNNGGETLQIVDGQGGVVKMLTYDDADPWPAAADGLGSSLALINPAANPDPNQIDSWRPSVEGGSPGIGDGEGVPAIVINEVLTHTDWPQVDAVELYNPTGQSVDVSGWYLTDDPNSPLKYRLPSGSILPAGGYLVLLEDNDEDPDNNAGLPPAFFGSAFSLSSAGDEIYLYSADGAGLTGYRDGFGFRGAANGVPFGRVSNSAGEVRYPALSSLTLGSANTEPLAPDVLLSEIMYHPADPLGPEYVEIWNVSDKTIQLFDAANPANTWRLDGMDFDFPEGQSLSPGALALVVEGDPNTFRAFHGLPPTIQVYGPAGGALDNGGERLELLRPDEPTLKGGELVVPMIVVDAVTFDDADPWPPAADGQGASLERLDPGLFSDDPGAWVESAQNGGSAGSLPGRLIVSVSVQGEGSVNVSPDQAAFDAGDEVSLTPVPAPGWEFARWTGSATGSEVPLSLAVNENLAVQAVFERVAVRYVLQSEVEGQGSVGFTPAQPEYEEGTVVMATATPSPGWRFLRWENALSGTGNPTSVTVDANKTVRAVFVQQVTVTIEGTGPGAVAVDPSKPNYDLGEEVTLTAIPSPGASFAGWGGDASGLQNPLTLTLNGNLTIEALFVSRVTLGVEANGPGSVSRDPAATDYLPGTVVTLTALPAPGAVFSGWSGGGVSGLQNPLEVTLTADAEITASFTAFLALEVPVEGEGSVSRSPQAEGYLPGTEVTLTAVPAPGWTFIEWRGAAAGASNPIDVVMTESLTVTAVFDQFFSVEASAEEGGEVTVSPSAPSYRRGAEVLLTATALDGYRFLGWSGDAEGVANPLTVSVESDLAYTAHFVPVITLTLGQDGEGQVAASPNKPLYDAGDRVTITASPAEGWTFVRWSGDLESESNPATLVMGGEDQSVSALFKRVFAIEVTTSGSGNVLRVPEGPNHVEGTEVTLTAVPAPGFEFVRWDGAGGDRELENPLVILADAAKSLTAVFEEIAVDSPYVAWAKQQFSESAQANPSISGPDADPDGDRMVNLLEMVMGTDPTDPLSLAGLAIEPRDAGDPDVVRVTAVIRAEEGVALRLEVSSDLKAWSANGIASGEPDGEIKTWRVPASSAARFCRLAVELENE